MNHLTYPYHWQGALFCLVGMMVFATQGWAQPTRKPTRIVELEINGGHRAEIELQQRWMEVLSDIGADRVRSRTSQAVEMPDIKETQVGSTAVIRVTGSLSGRNLILPGGKYSLNDKAALRDFIEKLKDDGTKVTLAEKKAFGLTSEQLVALHQSLSTPLSISTANRSIAEIARHIIDRSDVEFVVDSSAQSALRVDSERFPDELQGLSHGTALAAVVRPLGLVVAPRRQQGQQVKIHIVDTRAAADHWPIGWPAEKSVKRTVPKLGEREDMSIRDFPLGTALSALQKRVKIPFVYDQNSLARGGIDLKTAKISLVQKQIAYMVAIQKLARQTKPRMRAELRLDENGKPFLWLTTANPVR